LVSVAATVPAFVCCSLLFDSATSSRETAVHNFLQQLQLQQRDGHNSNSSGSDSSDSNSWEHLLHQQQLQQRDGQNNKGIDRTDDGNILNGNSSNSIDSINSSSDSDSNSNNETVAHIPGNWCVVGVFDNSTVTWLSP
jgi:hypothetical protein